MTCKDGRPTFADAARVFVANMSRTPEQQRAIVDRILVAWLRKPELRFGQMVSAAADRAEHDAFYIRDEALCEAVEALANGDPRAADPPEPDDAEDEWWAKRERPPERADDVMPEETGEPG